MLVWYGSCHSYTRTHARSHTNAIRQEFRVVEPTGTFHPTSTQVNCSMSPNRGLSFKSRDRIVQPWTSCGTETVPASQVNGKNGGKKIKIDACNAALRVRFFLFSHSTCTRSHYFVFFPDMHSTSTWLLNQYLHWHNEKTIFNVRSPFEYVFASLGNKVKFKWSGWATYSLHVPVPEIHIFTSHTFFPTSEWLHLLPCYNEMIIGVCDMRL